MLARALASSLALVAGCGTRAFVCTDAADCDDRGTTGVCEPDGGCSFPDAECESGRRYGTHAPDGKGGSCVPTSMPAETSSTLDPSIASTVADVSSAETTAVGESSTGAPATSEASDAASSDTAPPESSSDTGIGATTGVEPPVGFVDAFDRPDADALGNGWIEITPGSFQLVGEQVVIGDTNGLSFGSNVCRRPDDEALLDVEATIELTFSSDTYAGFPQLHLRSQPNANNPASVTAYVFYIDTTDPKVPPALDVVRIVDGSFGDAAEVALDPFPGAQGHYRLRARVSGTDPVVAEGWFETEVDGTWNVLTETVLVDPNPLRIVDPGVVSFSGHVQLQYVAYDDFAYNELAAP